MKDTYYEFKEAFLTEHRQHITEALNQRYKEFEAEIKKEMNFWGFAERYGGLPIFLTIIAAGGLSRGTLPLSVVRTFFIVEALVGVWLWLIWIQSREKYIYKTFLDYEGYETIRNYVWEKKKEALQKATYVDEYMELEAFYSYVARDLEVSTFVPHLWEKYMR